MKIAAFVLAGVGVAWGQTASDASAATQQRVDWKKLIPAIREVLKGDFPAEENEGLYVRTEADITGDGIPEALVNLGRGGAYTDYLAIMRSQNGRPVAAMFKEPNGKTLPLEFAEGANTITVELRPDYHAVFVGEYSVNDDGRHLAKCTGKAYQWNRQTATFEYSKRLSKRMGKDFCHESAKRRTAHDPASVGAESQRAATAKTSPKARACAEALNAAKLEV
jgi:hypothetical protein